jgi:2-polyprenyl-3-methyl-5-hydroxy-6-metoxy-1,4-benzoquinol methylase
MNAKLRVDRSLSALAANLDRPTTTRTSRTSGNDPRPEHLSRLYSEYAAGRSSFAICLSELLRTRSKPGCWSGVSVLDLGCGNGAIAKTFAELGASVTGIEYDAGRVKAMASAPLNFRLVAGDGHSLPFEDRSFDFVILADVLEHVANAGRVMQEVARVLRPGGVAYVGATNRSSIANILFDPHYNAPFIPLMSKRVAAWYVTKVLRLSRSFNVEKYFFHAGLLKCLESAGFTCEELRLYREKLRTSDLAAAPGRDTMRAVLAVPFVRRFAMWFADTWLFLNFVAPGFDVLCHLDRKSSGAIGDGRLACPECLRDLRSSDDHIECVTCNIRFEIYSGVPFIYPLRANWTSRS